jgi:superfamily II DNA or RNA helicase
VQIHINNLNCHIVDASPLQLSRIDGLFKVRQKNWWFNKAVREGRWDGYFHFFNIARGTLPTGLLEILLNHFHGREGTKSVRLVDERNDSPQVNRLRKLKGITLRDYQEDALNEAVSRVLRVDHLPSLPMPRGIVRLPTGSGKTEIIAGVCQRIRTKAVVLVHQRDLLHQTRERIAHRIDEAVGIIGDGHSEALRITVSTVQTLHRSLSYFAPWLKEQGVFISDEGHHLGAARTFRQVAAVCPAYVRLAFSATPFIPDDKVQQMRLLASTGPIIYTLEAADLIKADVIAPVRISMVALSTPTEVTLDSEDNIVRRSVELPYNGRNGAYQKLIVDNADRNKVIVDYAKRVAGPTLIIVTRLDHGKHLAEQLECPFLWGAENSALRKRTLKQLASGALRTLVASPIFDEGVDAPAIRHLVLAAGGKSDVKLLQRIGRGMRRKEGGKHLEVLDFIDGTNPYLLRHSEQRWLTAQKAGFDVCVHKE